MTKKTILIKLFFFAILLSAGQIFGADAAASSENALHAPPPAYSVIPFAFLLLLIAIGPLLFHHFWEKHYPKISVALGLIVVIFYLTVLHDSHALMHSLAEYISFIALLASLFVASGGILIDVDKKDTPMLNSVLLLIGAVVANIIGTTGASMLLIRPLIHINRKRIRPYHIIFFIFIVSNIGGALTPIGDPPLFVGFLRGVEFFWFIEHIWYIWLPTVLVVIAVFYFIDSRNHGDADPDEVFSGKIIFKGYRNVGFLLIILISVFIDPGVMDWVPKFDGVPFGLREIIMFSVIYFSYKTADPDILKANEFNFEPIKEVAYLFVGIFATMIPALQLIAFEAHEYGQQLTPGVFFWSTGLLSGVLDNTPTYLNFLSAALGKFGLDVNVAAQVHQFMETYPLYLRSISVGAVFFGALTYIGNGPNFMVKSIAESSGIKMPSFFAYLVKYALPILIPIFAVVWLIFFF